MQSSQANEFRKRQGGNVQTNTAQLPRSGNSTGSLPRPRPGASPVVRASPVAASRRSFSGGTSGMPTMPPVPFPAQRSSSFSGHSGHGSSNNSVSARPSYTTAAYNPNANNGGNTGGGGQYGSSNGSANYSGGYGNGLSSSSSRDLDNKYAKKRNRNSGPPKGLGIIVGGIVLFVYAVLMTTMYFSTNARTNSLLTRLDQPDTLSVIQKVEGLERKLQSSETTRKNAETAARNKVAKEINRLERENRMAVEEHSEMSRVHLPKAKTQLENHSRRETAFKNQVGWLMDTTRRESKRMVLERFGPGPHKVEFTYAISEPAPSAEKRHYNFVVELAPLEEVPHAIHLFLEQVDHGLMDGTHFYLNGPHIVQAGPQPIWDADGPVDGNDDVFQKDPDGHKNNHKISANAVDTISRYEKQLASNKAESETDDDEFVNYYSAEEYFEEDKRTKEFQDLGLDQLAFPDYSRDYPHRSWTVGYTGRPGGPDWYINKVDNQESHGPGGQSQHALEEQGDSCFGTISAEGNSRDLLAKYVYLSEVYDDDSEWHHFIFDPIEIVHAKILTREPLLDRHIHLDHLLSDHKVYDYRRRDHRREGELPDSSVQHGDGVDPARLPQKIQDMVSKKGNYSIKKIPHGHRPHLNGATEA